MKSYISLFSIGIVLTWMVGISAFATVPSTPPSWGVVWGSFSNYFKNIIEHNNCSGDSVITGFKVAPLADYGTPICTSISSLVSGGNAGGVWEIVPLTDTSDFDINCNYTLKVRFPINSGNYYWYGWSMDIFVNGVWVSKKKFSTIYDAPSGNNWGIRSINKTDYGYHQLNGTWTSTPGTLEVLELRKLCFSSSGGGTTATGTGSGWVDIPLTDTAPFDPTCHYRAKLDSELGYRYMASVQPDLLGVIFDRAFVDIIRSNEKTTTWMIDYGKENTWFKYNVVQKIQKLCNGGTGSSGWSSSIASYWLSNDNGANIFFTGASNVGIGTSTPSSKLDVVGGDAKLNGVTVGRGGGNSITNTVVGNTALPLANGGNNVALGNTALSNTTGGNNTAIGTSAGSNTTTGNNNIFIGNNAQGTSATASNQLNIGNWLYGNGGNIGIGVNTPVSKLQVSGGVKIANDADTCVSAKAGTMRYTGTAFQFCDGTAWQNINLGTAGLIPSGAIQAFYLASCPSGWLPANGTNGTPDLRGEFIRGLDSGRGVDASRTLGSSQVASRNSVVGNNTVAGILDGSSSRIKMAGTTGSNTNNTYTPNGEDLHTASIQDALYVSVYDTYATFTLYDWAIRPRNVALLYCMKQ